MKQRCIQTWGETNTGILVSIRFGLDQFQISQSDDYTAPASKRALPIERRPRLIWSVLVSRRCCRRQSVGSAWVTFCSPLTMSAKRPLSLSRNISSTHLSQCLHNMEKPLPLYLSIIGDAVGSMLAQEDDDKNERAIYYLSKKFNDYETVKCTPP